MQSTSTRVIFDLGKSQENDFSMKSKDTDSIVERKTLSDLRRFHPRTKLTIPKFRKLPNSMKPDENQ